MEISPALIALIRQEIKTQMNIILGGRAGRNSQHVEDIDNMFPGMNTITNRPIMHPYGFVSRAPRGTTSVVGRQGEHFGNRIVLGHRDPDRPALQEGETILYNQYGRAIKVLQNKILIGGDDSTENVVLGQVEKTIWAIVLQAIADHRHIDSFGYYTTTPDNASTYLTEKTTKVDNEVFLSDESFARKNKSGG